MVTQRGRASVKWYYRVGVVLLLLFGVLGPFALPLLWKSPRFPWGLKLALTLLVMAIALWIIGTLATAIGSLLQSRQELELLLP